MAASDARPVPRKNVAYRYYFAIRKPSDGTLITTWAGADTEVSLDGAAYADCTSEATEIGTTGTGYIDLTAAEMNADAVLLKITVTNTGAVPLVFTLFPEEVGDYRADAVMLSGDSAAADNAESFFDGTGYAGTNNVIPTVTTTTNVTTVNGLAANVITAASIATDAIGADEIAAGAVTKIQTGLATPTNITAATGIVLSGVTHTGAVIPTVTTLTGHTPQTGDSYPIVSSATSGNAALKTLIDAVDDLVDTEVAAIYTRLGAPAGASIAADIAAVLAKWTTAVTESYAADGSAPTPEQALMMILQSIHEFAISSTTRTVKKLDGVTTAMTFTLDSATAPTSTTRAT